MRWFFGHPSTKRLRGWLDGTDDDLEDHVFGCDRCANRLEALAADQPELRARLVELLRPPEDLDVRLQGGIDERLRSREDLALVGELFTVPFEAVRIISTTDQGDT